MSYYCWLGPLRDLLSEQIQGNYTQTIDCMHFLSKLTLPIELLRVCSKKTVAFMHSTLFIYYLSRREDYL